MHQLLGNVQELGSWVTDMLHTTLLPDMQLCPVKLSHNQTKSIVWPKEGTELVLGLAIASYIYEPRHQKTFWGF